MRIKTFLTVSLCALLAGLSAFMQPLWAQDADSLQEDAQAAVSQIRNAYTDEGLDFVLLEYGLERRREFPESVDFYRVSH